MRRFAFIVAGVIAWFALSAGVLEANHERLDICCAWNNELADGELTYSVSGGDAGARAAVESAVLDWNAVPGLTLVEDETAPNIKVQLKNGGGTIAGQAQRRFDNAGFVREVRLIISGKSFGDPNLEDTLKEITRHETGHALGLSHANFVGSLMDPTVGGEDQIKQCEISGVQAANAWFFGGGGTPAQPTVDSVACSEGPGGTDIFLTALEVSSSTVNQGDTVSFTTTAVNHGQADPLDDITATLTVTRDQTA